jgi:hypothetical protein
LVIARACNRSRRPRIVSRSICPSDRMNSGVRPPGTFKRGTPAPSSSARNSASVVSGAPASPLGAGGTEATTSAAEPIASGATVGAAGLATFSKVFTTPPCSTTYQREASPGAWRSATGEESVSEP